MRVALLATVACLIAGTARGDSQPPAPEVSLAVGGAAYDESPFGWSHYAGALAGRFHFTNRLAVDGEVAYLPGFCGSGTCWPSGHRDLLGSLALAIDLRSGRPPVQPYLALGGGYLAYRDGGFGQKRWAAIVGFGVRVSINDHLFVSPDLRLVATSHGHLRSSLALGWRF